MNFINIDTLIYLVSNLFRIYVMLGLVEIFFYKQNQAIYWKHVIFVMFYLVNSGLHLVFQNPSVNLCTNIFFIFLITCAYKSKLSLKLLATILIVAVLMAADQIPYAILNNLGFLNNIVTITNILSSILVLILVLILKRVVAESFYGALMWTQLVMVISIPLGSIFILAISFALITDFLAVFFITSMLLFMDVMVFKFYDILVKYCADKQIQHNLERQNADYAHEFEVIAQSDNNIRKIKHDLINHLVVLQGFIETNKNEKAVEYIEKIYDFTKNKGQFVATGNHQIDSILNYKLQKAEDMDTLMFFEIIIPEVLEISSFDMNIIVGNLLDNALEAIAECEEKRLEVCMELKMSQLHIAISNTFKNHIQREKNKFITGKADKENHGIGLENVKAAVEKYSGTFEAIIDEDLFTVEISMLNESV